MTGSEPFGAGADEARSSAALRRAIRTELPEAAFHPRPSRALFFLPLLAVEVAATVALARDWGGVAALPLLGVVAGSTYASLLLLSHEVMHGAVVRSRQGQQALAWLGFTPFLISPTLWRVWHNEVHHGHANDGDRDPDTFASTDQAAASRASRAVLRLVPGSGGLCSGVLPFFWFAAHGQIVLWHLSRVLPGFERLRRKKAMAEVAAMASFWLSVSWLIGLPNALTAVAFPLAIGNAILMAYIFTNHLLRPLVGTGDPLAVAMSVRTPEILDRLHFRFSHHVEHHLFPAMCGQDLPKVRGWLEEHASNRFVCPPHSRALRALYATPRNYRDRDTLVDPLRPERAPVDLERLGRHLARRA